MGYFSDLRKLVGNRPLLLIGATVLIIDDENRLLLMKRSDNECWGPPGGAVEPGETVEVTARREAFEETGLEISDLSLFGVFSGLEQYYRYPNGDEVYNVAIVYLCRHARGEVCLSNEHTEWKYFPLSDFPSPLSPPIIPIVKRLLEEFSIYP